MIKKCKNKTKFTCEKSTPAECTEFEGNVNINSSLDLESCKSVEETTQDIYEQLEDIELSELGQNCLNYTTEDGRIKVKTVLLKYEEEICTLKQKITELETVAICDIDITGCNFNFGDLVDACGDVPTTFKGIIQLLLNQHITP